MKRAIEHTWWFNNLIDNFFVNMNIVIQTHSKTPPAPVHPITVTLSPVGTVPVPYMYNLLFKKNG